MQTLGYYNGKFDELEKMQIPFLDRVSFYGDGVYDATMSRNHKILFLDEHIARFYNSARLLRIQIPMTEDELKDLLGNLVQKVDSGEQFVYWQVTRGTDRRHHDFPDGPANLWVMLQPQPLVDLSVPVDAVTTEDTRFFHCNIKTLNLIPNVLAAQKAKEAGAYECIFVRPDGNVTECAHSNVHIIKDGTLITHPADNLILPGIGRAHLIAMCRAQGVSVEERPFTQDELMDADEIVISASSTYAMRVAHIDGRPVGGKAGEILSGLQAGLTEEAFSATEV